MSMTPAQLAPAIILPLVAWRIYVRAKRNVGRQRFQPRRMIARIVILSVLSLLFGVGTLTHPSSLGALGGGLLVGLPLALLGLYLTRFETSSEGHYYTPNTFIGIAVTLLFVGRLIYRVIILSPSPAMRDPSLPQFFQSPLTFFVFGLTAGYYIAYYSGVLKKLSPKPAGN
jgi:hypothetical protein